MDQKSTWNKKQQPYTGTCGFLKWLTRDKLSNYQYIVLNMVRILIYICSLLIMYHNFQVKCILIIEVQIKVNGEWVIVHALVV